MARRVRKSLLAIVPIALIAVLLVVLLSGLSGSSTHHGPGCNNPADSALNQYCDSVPAGTGAQEPRAGEAALALRLSPRLVSRIEHGSGSTGLARRELLRLPAPGRRRPLLPTGGTQQASVTGLSSPMIVVLIVLGVLLAGGAGGVRWRAERRNR